MLNKSFGFKKTKHCMLVSFVLILSVLFTVTAVSQEITPGGKRLVIRGDYNAPPYEFMDNGKPTGFSIDLTQAVAEVMGLEVEIRLGNWDEVRRDLEMGRIDVITGMGYSKERDNFVDFSVPHHIVYQAIFVRKGSSISSLESIKDKEIIVQEGDIMHDYVKENDLSANIIVVEDQTEALRLLASGKHDCALLMKLHGLYLVNKLKLTNIKTVGPEILPMEYCFAVTEGDSLLLAQLNEGLGIIKQTGKYNEIYNKWFGIYIKPILVKTIFKYVALILLPLLLLLLVALGWSWSLRKLVIKKTFELKNELVERKKAEALLSESEQRLRKMNDVLTSIAKNKTIAKGDLAASFREITESAANTLEVDSSSIWLLNDDKSKLCCHDNFLRNIGKHVKGKEIDICKFKSFINFETIEESRSIAVKDTGTEPLFKEVYEQYFPKSGVTSMIKAQIRSGGEIRGVLSIDNVGAPRTWTFEEQNFAGSLADISSIAIETSERMKAEKELENKIALESLISQIASKFMHISPFEIDIGINHALRRVGEFEGIDRIYVYTFNEDATRMNNTHEWCGDGIEPEIQNLQNLDTSQFPWWIGKLKKLEIIYIPYVDELPEDAKIEKEILQSYNVKSELVVPMEYHNSLYGYIGFDKANTEKKWTEDSILVLEQVGRIIVNALEHKRLHEELRKANEDLERKVEERTRELRQKQAQLVQSEKMASLGNLVAGVAHEINTPLGALKSNNDIFIRSIKKMKSILSDVTGPEDSPKEPDLAKLFTSIEKLNEVNKTASERIVNIVNSLRTFARLDKAEMDTVDIHEGIESTLTLVHHEFKRRIEVHKDFGEIPKISCYPNQLNQVFMNILVNAGQAIEGKGDIFIKTYTKNNKAIIEIKDTGKGIPEDNLNRIFDPGYTTKSKGIGTGLGLSIVYQIIENHNGSIEVESEIGKGSLFRIILPL